MNLKKIAGTAALTGALGAAALGVGSGWAQADPDWIDPDIPVPGIDIWDPVFDWGPPPGQIKKWCPWHSPPGHWIGGPHGIPCT